MEWRKPNMSQAAVEALQNGKDKLGDIAGSGALTSTCLDLQALGATAQGAEEASGVAETTFTEVRDQLTNAEFDAVLQRRAGITLRELLGLVKVSQTTRGELTNNLTKVTELNKNIAMEKRKLGEANNHVSTREPGTMETRFWNTTANKRIFHNHSLHDDIIPLIEKNVLLFVLPWGRVPHYFLASAASLLMSLLHSV